MKKQAIRKCKGVRQASGYGCDEIKTIHKYGICKDCFSSWLLNTKEGKKVLEKSRIQGRKRSDKERKKENRKKKEDIRQKSFYEKKLQNIINSIVRLIDIDKGCISCGHGWDGKWSRQRHAGHRLSVGSYPELRFNLINNFSQCSVCNNFKSANEREYDKGLIKHYGESFYNEVSDLKGKYKTLKLTKQELQEIIEKANKIKQDILSGKDYTRKEINTLLKIYK